MRIIALIFFVLTTVPCSAQTYRVMTYNIRYDNPQDGINRWSNRITKVTDLIRKHDPDVIGIQEALKHQLDDLIKALPQYEFVGVAREDGKAKGEFSAILYKNKKFELLHDSTFWLSLTPQVVGSKDWDASLTRVATIARLKDKKTKVVHTTINTHFDHVGQESRKQSALLLKQFVKGLGEKEPVLITGDFNCMRSDAPYTVMVEKSQPVLFDPAPENPPGTFCNFQLNSMTCRGIDYIFHTGHWNSSSYQVITDNDGQYYPSDHLPVMVEVAISNKKKSK